MMMFNPEDYRDSQTSDVQEKEILMPSGKATFHIKPLAADDSATLRIMMSSNDPVRVSNAIHWEINRSVVFPDGGHFDKDGNEALPVDIIKTLKDEVIFGFLMAIHEVNNPDPKP